MVTDTTPPRAALHPALAGVTRRIVERSAPLRTAYLQRVDALAARPRGSDRFEPVFSSGAGSLADKTDSDVVAIYYSRISAPT